MTTEQRVEELSKKTDALSDYLKHINSVISGVFEKMTHHLQKIEGELGVLNAKVDALQGNTDHGFGDVKGRLTDIKNEISKINDVTGYEDIFKNQSVFRNPAGEA